MQAVLEREATLERKSPGIEARPLGSALVSAREEALMPRSEAPDPIVLERLRKTPLDKWLNHRPDPAKRRYGIDRPMEMLYVPPSDAEAARIRSKSEVDYRIVSTDEVMTRAQALKNNFAFLSMYSKRGGESSAQTSVHSQGFAWDRQSRGIENAGVDILEAVGGTKDVVWVRVGDEKIVGFFRGKRDMQTMAEASVAAPTKAYETHLPHLAKAQVGIQEERMVDVLDPVKGSARKWKEVKEGTRDGMKRAWDDKDDSTLSFWFAGEQAVIDGKLKHQGIGLNNERITWEKLALEAPELKLGDTTTTDVMLSLDQYFLGEDSEDRFAVMFTWSPDTTCCADAVSSANAGQEALVVTNKYELNAVQAFTSSRISGKELGTVSYPNGETYHSKDYCSGCSSKKNSEGKCESCSSKKS